MAAKPLALGLIVIGVIALIYGGITYTSEEALVELGPLEARTETRKTVPLPPVLGALCLAGGVVLLVVGWRKKL